MASLLRLSPDDAYEPSTATVLLGWYGGDGMSLLEASLFVSLGIMLLCRVRERSYGKTECLKAEESCKSARRLSEEGFGGDLCMVDELDSHSYLGVRWSGCRALGTVLRSGCELHQQLFLDRLEIWHRETRLAEDVRGTV